MKNNSLYLTGFHLSTLRRKPRSVAHKLADSLAQIRRQSISSLGECWFTRKDRMDSSEAYFLAGRSLTAWVIAGSLLLTNLSTEHLIGLNADAFNHTIAVMAWETTAALAMVLAAIYFVPRYLRMEKSGHPHR